MKFVIQ